MEIGQVKIFQYCYEKIFWCSLHAGNIFILSIYIFISYVNLCSVLYLERWERECLPSNLCLSQDCGNWVPVHSDQLTGSLLSTVKSGNWWQQLERFQNDTNEYLHWHGNVKTKLSSWFKPFKSCFCKYNDSAILSHQQSTKISCKNRKTIEILNDS